MFDDNLNSARVIGAHIGKGASSKSRANPVLRVRQKGKRYSKEVVRLLVQLENIARAELPVLERISLLNDLQPKASRLAKTMPKPSMSSRGSAAGGAQSQTLEEMLYSLMARNMIATLDALGQSYLTYTYEVSWLRNWLIRNLYRYWGRSIEYAVRWNRPYPAEVWLRLHGLHLVLGSRADLAEGQDDRPCADDFDPDTEYKRLLLLGLVRDLSPVQDRPPEIFEALEPLAKESRLLQAESYFGAFDLYVVEISRDEPAHLSGLIEMGFNGWIFKPTTDFFSLLSESGSDERNPFSISDKADPSHGTGRQAGGWEQA